MKPFIACHHPICAPLFCTGVNLDGKALVGGVYRMQDSIGMPLEITKMEADEKGFYIDWLEALCDCWLNDCLKFDSFCRDIASCRLNEDVVDKWKTLGAFIIAKFPKIKQHENPVDVVCRYILQKKKIAGKFGNQIWGYHPSPIN